MSTPFETAKAQGYSDDEIFGFLEKSPTYSPKIAKAREQGYSNEEITKFLGSNEQKSQQGQIEQNQPVEESSIFEKVMEVPKAFVRKADVFGTNAAAGLRAIPRTGFDLLTTIVGATGGDLSKLEEAQANAPEWLKNFASSAFPTFEEQKKKYQEDGSPVEEGFVENVLAKAGRFVGEAPAFGGVGGAKGLASIGGMAVGSQIAEDQDLGPVASIALGVGGALAPSSIASASRGIKNIVSKPKETLAKIAAYFTPKDKLALQQQIIQDARKAGVQLDIGSITDSNLLKQTQSILAQSGLTGTALDDLKLKMTGDIAKEYKAVADNLGKARFQTNYEASQVVKEAIKNERNASKQVYKDIYDGSMKALGEDAIVYPDRVISSIERIESKLSPGGLKTTEQKSVLNMLEDIKKDILSPEGGPKGAKVKDLINDKIALHDIINYEIDGGTKQLLKDLAKEIDNTIIQHGIENPKFARDYKMADKKFGEYAQTYRNKNISAILKGEDPMVILSKMKSVQGIKDVKKALDGSAESRQLFNDLKRFKMDQIFENNLVDSTTKQAKFGTFSKVLEKSNNRELMKELLGTKDLNRLESLMKVSGNLAESANKFYNSSKSASKGLDIAAVVKFMTDAGHLMSGNPWPIARTTAGLATAKVTAKLFADPKFLKLAEEAVLALKVNNPRKMKEVFEKMGPMIEAASRQAPTSQEQSQENILPKQR